MTTTNPNPIDYTGIAGGYARARAITVCVHCFYEDITTQGFLFGHANVSIGHNLLKPWVDLFHYGAANGIRFVTADQLESLSEVDAVLFSDRPAASSAVANRLLELPVPKYLYLCETEVIKPDNWDRAYHARFDKVFTLHDDWVDHIRYIKVFQALEPVMATDVADTKARFGQRKLCTLIAGAKMAQHANELYSARIATIQWMQTHAAADFDLYGVGWQPLNLPCYRGTTDDKLATLAGYRFAICYENARNFPGYITEKLFDCLLAGTVPVYWGAPNIADWVPADCYIDRRLFASEEALHAHIKGMDAQTHGAYLDRIATFFQSAQVYPFTIENFITTVTAHIAKDVKQQRGESPVVSVCIPNFNYGHYVAQAVESALAQDIPGMEVLVFDNASTDSSMARLQPYARHPQVRVVRNTRNFGSLTNWHNAFRCAAGSYFSILSADDFFRPMHLAPKIQRMEHNPHVALAYCPCMHVDSNGLERGVSMAYGHPDQDYCGGRNEVADLLTYDSYITPSAALVRRASFEALGWTPERQLHGAGDWSLWIRLAERFPDFAYLRDARVCYRVHGAQHTQQLLQGAEFLQDHVQILEDLHARGSDSRIAQRATEIIALLWARYQRTPATLAAPLQARIHGLEVRLLNHFLNNQLPRLASGAQQQSVMSAFRDCLQSSLPLLDLVNQAQALVQNGHWQLGAALYRSWLTHSASAQAFVAAYNLAVAMDGAGDVQQALMYFSQALALNPGFTQGQLALDSFRSARQQALQASLSQTAQ